jgi:hypothetical protein
VADLVAGRDGEDNLLGIEALEFTNPAIWRFYNLLTGVHFFTQSAAERDYVLASFPQFHFEGLGLRALSDTGSPGATPVFRFYNERTQAHFFTASAAERAWVAATLPQFHDEGIAFWEDAAGGAGLTPVYRFFNATTQAHFYTPSAAERDYIVATFAEWHAEGVAYHTPTTATDLMPLG